MLKLLPSIFNHGFKGSTYSESIVTAAIEHAVDCTDPRFRAVNGFKKKLIPAVIRTLDYVGALVDEMPQPIILDHMSYDSDPRLLACFISLEEMQKIIGNDRNLRNFLRGCDDPLPIISALMVMNKRERGGLGDELSGDIIMRGVSRITETFDAHKFIAPCRVEADTRHQLKNMAFDHLLGLALGRITAMKTARGTLEQCRELLSSKLNLLQHSRSGFNTIDAAENMTVADVEKSLKEIDAGLMELSGDDMILEIYLRIVIGVLNYPEKHLWGRKEKLVVDRMCTKRNVATIDVPEVTLDVLCDSEGTEAVVSLVSLSNIMENQRTYLTF